MVVVEIPSGLVNVTEQFQNASGVPSGATELFYNAAGRLGFYFLELLTRGTILT